MDLFNKFGRKPDAAKREETRTAESAGADKNANLIRVFDGYGRELFVTRQQWLDTILPANLKKAWDKPDELYGMIASALADGFRSAVVEAAEHLYQIDSDRDRSVCLWGIVLMEEARLDEAEKVLRDFLHKHGENGYVLTNLAKVYHKRKDEAKRDEILWHALEIDPNQENAGNWYRAHQREQYGEDGERRALERMAALNGSWRAQLWIARDALAAKQFDRAMAYYREALANVGKPIPTDLLLQMSGDLGKAGRLSELLELTEPLFDVNQHGLMVGNNLIKAHVDTGNLDAARQLVDALYACKRPDWQKTLSFWDTEIAKARIAAVPIEQAQPLQAAMIAIANPIWLPASSPACELFPSKPRDEYLVCFLGASASVGETDRTVGLQMADRRGRLSRALPLFLAEQVHFISRARVQTLVPLLMANTTGLILSGVPWSDEDSVKHAVQATPPGDYIVVTHLLTEMEPWKIELRLLRTADGKCLAMLNQTFPSAAPGEQIVQLATELLAALHATANLNTLPLPAHYAVPPAPQFANYLLRLEQLLAVRCATIEGVKPDYLHGEREILDGNIQLCLACPENSTVRIVLAQTVKAMKKARPDIVSEFTQKLALLQKQKPLSEPTQSIVNRIMSDEP